MKQLLSGKYHSGQVSCCVVRVGHRSAQNIVHCGEAAAKLIAKLTLWLLFEQILIERDSVIAHTN